MIIKNVTLNEQGIITDTTKQRLMDAEERQKALRMSIAKEEIKKPPITKEQIEFFLRDIRNRVLDAEEQTEIIINSFVNSVYLYDDKLIITYNLKEGDELKKLELGELEKFGFNTEGLTRKRKIPLGVFRFLLCYPELRAPVKAAGLQAVP